MFQNCLLLASSLRTFYGIHFYTHKNPGNRITKMETLYPFSLLPNHRKKNIFLRSNENTSSFLYISVIGGLRFQTMGPNSASCSDSGSLIQDLALSTLDWDSRSGIWNLMMDLCKILGIESGHHPTPHRKTTRSLTGGL